MPRKRGEPKEPWTVYTPVRWAAKLEAVRARHERGLRALTKSKTLTVSTPEFIAYLVGREIGE